MIQKLKSLDGKWQLCYQTNEKCVDCADFIRTVSDIKNSHFPILKASVPGNFELDLLREGLIEDPFLGTNSWKMRDWEKYHVWYFTTFDGESLKKDDFIRFEGIDTVADIYLNGSLVKTTDNMFMSYDVPMEQLVSGANELVVHIKPVTIYTRQFELPAASHAMTRYMYESLYVRKAAHMYGWDIMPRIVSCGIWKSVSICRNHRNRIKNAFVFTMEIKEDNSARLCANLVLNLTEDDLRGYRIEIDGKCEESVFRSVSDVWHTGLNVRFWVQNSKLWWPKGAGKPNLYDVTVKLYLHDELCDTFELKTGIRMVELENTAVLDEKGTGKFCFKINGEPIYIRGTNWVPLDAFHSRDIERLPKALELLDEIDCNMVRCWGGNVYENDMFYDFCDEHGILIWQDFAMGCAVYPQEQRFYDMIAEEVEFVVKRLRNHPALALWSGDNEGDVCYRSWLGFRKNPNRNKITRCIIPDTLYAHDFTRPYLQSSPFISDRCFEENMKPVEEHPWGVRDWYKSDWYKNLSCIFASEIGFYGVPERSSIEKFISKDKLWPMVYRDGTYNEEWVAHSTSPEFYIPNSPVEQPFAYFAGLPYKNVMELTGSEPDSLDDYIWQSQIFQAEAFKYIIEKFRAEKWNKSGVIWWNLLNGWPQIDNGVVDYYFTKKLAFSYIKQSQQAVCLMIAEQADGSLTLVGCNDTLHDVQLQYSVSDITNKTEVSCNQCVLKRNSSAEIESIPVIKGQQIFYAIRWTLGDKNCKNHYVSFERPLNVKQYTKEVSQYRNLT